MAILSNGKFYGFLCSAKETGRKLANGVKEYVEDFVSGFAGHGWKIWEYVKGKWMLEIDSIRVRGQFTVFELLVSKIRAIIGAQAITQGCGKIKTVELSEDGAAYLLTIEDKDMSFMEHDFIRCQVFHTGQKLYHVEIESIENAVIRIPVSEFVKDAEGNVTNPPVAGDDIVQFGNSSHDEKYVGRHSAIYMHADEGAQPAIDVLDGIYSKDWSNCLKVRMGGDIPGTNKLKGLYCVNGMIKCADDSGITLYQLNPDGSGFLAKGNIAWDKDGNGSIFNNAMYWDEEGFHLSNGIKIDWDMIEGSPDWINQWTKAGTTIGDKFIASPTGFFGSKDKDGRLTGILMGKDVSVKKKNANGEIVEEIRTGIFALVDDEIVFELDPVNKKYVFKGRVEADSGVFKGKVDIAGGKILLNEDGSGQLANGDIRWTKDGSIYLNGFFASRFSKSYEVTQESYPKTMNFIVTDDSSLDFYLPNSEMYIGSILTVYIDKTITNKNSIRIGSPSVGGIPTYKGDAIMLLSRYKGTTVRLMATRFDESRLQWELINYDSKHFSIVNIFNNYTVLDRCKISMDGSFEDFSSLFSYWDSI